MPIQDKDFHEVCDNLRKRIIKILYLKEDKEKNIISEYDVISYINALIWDLYGSYVVFNNYKFLNAICELEGIKENIDNDFTRKKVLDLASFTLSIADKKGR